LIAKNNQRIQSKENIGLIISNPRSFINWQNWVKINFFAQNNGLRSLCQKKNITCLLTPHKPHRKVGAFTTE
jgi:hypothetical protein